MVKILLYIVAGFLLGGSGFFLAYIYLKGLDEGSNFLLLVPSILLIICGVYSLFRATKSDYIIGVKNVDLNSASVSGEKKQSLLERNNELGNEWAKTNEARDKLKMLKLVAAAADKK